MEITLLQLLGLAGHAVRSADPSLAGGAFQVHLVKLQNLARGKRLRGIRIALPEDTELPAGWYPKDCNC